MSGERLTDAERVSRILEIVDMNLERWETWFPNPEHVVEVPRADLLAMVAELREHRRREAAVQELISVIQAEIAWEIENWSPVCHNRMHRNIATALAAYLEASK